MFETDFMKLYEELSAINGKTDLESIVNIVATEVEKYDEKGSNQNCLFSTWAVELQLRGEDFLPRPVYSPRDPVFDIKGEELVIEPEILKISSKEDVETQVLDAGDGARFYCHVNWADSKGGHEFLLINDNDSVLVVDGQAGYIKEINKDKKYFDDINFENSYIVRFDNKEINQDILKYNDDDQIVEWDDELDSKLLEEDFSNNNEFFHSLIDELSEFDYAFIDGDGEELDDEDAMDAVVQSPEQLANLGKGVCTDFVEYTRAKLDDRNISYKVYDVACTDKDGDHPAHVFIVVKNEGKFLWLEAAWYSEAGIHEYNSLEELFEDIARKHCIYDGENYLESCEIREIKKSLVGMSQEAIYDYVDTLPITWKAAEEGITENLIENLIVNKKDILLNFEQFESSKINVLLVTGFSGSGKSTLASELARKYSAMHYELDCLDFWNSELMTTSDLVGKEDGLLAFIKANNIKPNKNASNDEINTLYKSYIEFLISWCRQQPQQKFIIEGLQLYTVYDKLSIDLTGYPVIIKGTSGIISAFRAGKRNAKANNTGFINELKLLLPWLRHDNRLLNQLARGLAISEGLEKETGIVFLSDKNMDGKTLTPRVPNNFLIKNGYEDSITPRICFASSIDKALMAISRNLTGEELFVHQPKSINKKAIYKPSIKEVPDVKITGEIWYKEPVELQCVGKILITADDGKAGRKYTYGNHTAELYGWNWEWLEN